MSTIRFILLISLFFNLLGCRLDPGAQRAKALMGEANSLLEQESRVTQEWSVEYGKVFTPQNRAQFPSNRESLRGHAEKVISLLDESARLSSAAAEKYEQAVGLVNEDKEKRGLVLFAASFRKDVEITGLFKEQMRLAANSEIKDQKTFNEKFMNLTQLIEREKRKRDDQQNEGKRLMGL